MSHATTALPRPLLRADQVRELDRIAIVEEGIPGAELMERAGMAVYRTLRARWPEARRLRVWCGGGNNGGDGFVVARLARQAGLAATVTAVMDPAGLQGDARVMAEAAVAAGVTVVPLGGGGDPGEADLMVDALLGTGIDRELTGAFREAVAAVNGSRRPVVAVDIPSGLHADSGRVMGLAVRATVTVSFIGLKRGLFTGAGPEYAGQVLYHGLGVPDRVLSRVTPAAVRLDGSEVRLAPRPRDAHKGVSGHVVVVGGDHGMGGAPRLAALGAARAGAGLVSVATRPEYALPWQPELMTLGVGGQEEIAPVLARASVVVLGPGLGQGAWGQSLAAAAFAAARPLVVDADALNLLAQVPRRRDDWVLTPHPGEAARLLASDVATVQGDRFAAVTALAEGYGGVVVLKGAGTLVAGGRRPLSVCTAGNPGMATGGMGDLLAGVIGALLAQGLEPGAAARAAVCLHARAADRAARDGERGLLATDLLPHLRVLVNRSR